ncbi:hypothetical protein IJE86_10180 [bacterium]|nr:hypothetical protein [bacterium]
MKKFLALIIFILCALLFSNNTSYATILEPIYAGTLYFSPSQNTWASTSHEKDTIKLNKKGTKYYIDGKFAFEIDSNYDFIGNGKFAAVNNNTLKFYTITYNNDKFQPAEMTTKSVQEIFDDVKVIATSDFKNNEVTIKRTPFQVEQFLIVNDTNMNFENYRFSPTSVNRAQFKGMFLARKVGAIHFVKNNDTYNQYPKLKIKIRNDEEKYKNPQPVKILHPQY